MQIVELGPFDSILDVMLDADGNPNGYGRPGGLHLSHCIQAWRKLKGGKEGPDGEQDGIRMYMGFLWEWALELAFKAVGLLRGPMVLKQLRLEHDGIHMTLDALDLENEEPILEEYKLTWRSTKWLREDDRKKPLSLAEAFGINFWTWVVQVLGYLKGASEHLGKPVRVVRFFVFFVMGDYSFQRKRGPQIKVFEIRFTDDEVEGNWRTILNLAADLKKEGL